MRRFIAILSLMFAVPALATAGATTQTIAVSSSTATQVTTGLTQTTRRGTILYNAGPNTIYCAVGNSALATVAAGFPVAAGGTLTIGTRLDIYCLAGTADQVLPNGTKVIEVP